MKIHLLAIAAGFTLACTTARSGTIFRAVPWGPAVIPQYSIDSVTRDSASNRVYALVGTAVNSASGAPLEGTQILLKQPPNGRVFFAQTDSHGGFVLGRVPAGHYQLLIRRIGFHPLTGTRDARMGAVDTLRARLQIDTMGLQTLVSKAD